GHRRRGGGRDRPRGARGHRRRGGGRDRPRGARARRGRALREVDLAVTGAEQRAAGRRAGEAAEVAAVALLSRIEHAVAAARRRRRRGGARGHRRRGGGARRRGGGRRRRGRGGGRPGVLLRRDAQQVTPPNLEPLLAELVVQERVPILELLPALDV